MGVRHPKQEQIERLESKTLDAQLRQILVAGLACSPFEAAAVLDAVKEVYAPFFDGPDAAASQPGRVTLVAVAADEPAGKAVADCHKRTVSLTLHRGASDDRLLDELGPRGFRRERIPDLCQQALSQGALLTREDLACRLFLVGLRTISRDLAWLRAHDRRPLPLRGTVHDIGPVLTHRVEVVRLALEGKTTSEICTILRHSPSPLQGCFAYWMVPRLKPWAKFQGPCRGRGVNGPSRASSRRRIDILCVKDPYVKSIATSRLYLSGTIAAATLDRRQSLGNRVASPAAGLRPRRAHCGRACGGDRIQGRLAMENHPWI